MPIETVPPARPAKASTPTSRDDAPGAGADFANAAAAADASADSASVAATDSANTSAGVGVGVGVGVDVGAAAEAANTDAQRHRIQAARSLHWTRTRRVTARLLTLWLATGFCTVFFARDLAHLSVFGWPLSFYLAAQGASLIYLTIIGVYAWHMGRLDRDFARQLKGTA